MATLPALDRQNKQGSKTTYHRNRQSWRNNLGAYLYILPAATILFIFHIVPVFYGLYMSSFKHWGKVVGSLNKRQQYVGLQNYSETIQDPAFRQALGNTVWFALGTVPFTIFWALILAILLFQKISGQGFYRTVYFLPYITSTTAAATIFSVIFSSRSASIANTFALKIGLGKLQWTQEPKGIFVMLADHYGQKLPDWAGGPSLALFCVMLLNIWIFLGYDTVIFLAGLGNISRDLYEAARVDGANERQLFRYITWPLITPTTFFLTIISTIGALQAFNQVFQFSSQSGTGVGGPNGATTTVVIYIYNQIRDFPGPGSAASFILFALILLLTLIQLNFVGKRVNY